MIMEKETVEYIFRDDQDAVLIYRDSDIDQAEIDGTMDRVPVNHDLPLEDLYQAFKARLLRELLE